MLIVAGTREKVVLALWLFNGCPARGIEKTVKF